MFLHLGVLGLPLLINSSSSYMRLLSTPLLLKSARSRTLTRKPQASHSWTLMDTLSVLECLIRTAHLLRPQWTHNSLSPTVFSHIVFISQPRTWDDACDMERMWRSNSAACATSTSCKPPHLQRCSGHTNLHRGILPKNDEH